MTRRIPWLGTWLLAACAASDALTPVNDRSLPTNLRLQAQASGSDAGKELDCLLDVLIRLEGSVDRATARVVQHGTGGGDAHRGWTLSAGGGGISFWAELFIADLEAHLIGADSLELRSPASQADTESRFWHELGLLTGNTRGAEPGGVLARGTWTCHPMDTPPSSGEYYDVTGSVAGTWTLVALP